MNFALVRQGCYSAPVGGSVVTNNVDPVSGNVRYQQRILDVQCTCNQGRSQTQNLGGGAFFWGGKIKLQKLIFFNFMETDIKLKGILIQWSKSFFGN